MVLPAITRIAHRYLDVDGARAFSRESLPERPDAPVLLLLHGFPSGSHPFPRLIAPDYPGFGHTEAPDDFTYSIDRLAGITEALMHGLDLTRFVIYMFDFGAPIGFRLAERHPERVAGLVVQKRIKGRRRERRWSPKWCSAS
ncbi:alpha/beta fold hydrolase [Nonomuraea sp. NPDC046802]|uniref:alpha/beta fold hydrolase n=1 Tax=Nonomuraea sp. NPDC046802 TaxID=3154919 RepID=UPI0033C09B62